jgi:ADP-ribosylation factor-like protein 2
MGLLRIIRKTKKQEREMRLLMLGLDNAGKTTVLMAYCKEPLDDIPPTVGFNIKTLITERYKVNIWDVGGQKSIRSFWRNYFETTDGLIWVVDSSDKHRLNDCREELTRVLGEEKLWGASLLIVANKQDIAGACTVDEISEILEIPKIQAARRNCAVVGCSAYDLGSVEGAINWIIKDIGDRIYTMR